MLTSAWYFGPRNSIECKLKSHAELRQSPIVRVLIENFNFPKRNHSFQYFEN